MLVLCTKQTLPCTRQALQTSITSKTVCDSSQSVPSIEVATCRRHRRAQDRAVLAASALAMLVAEQPWLALVSLL